MGSITKIMDKTAALNFRNNYPQAKVCKTPPYALYQIKTTDLTITAYESGKVVIQGAGIEDKPLVAKPKVKQVYPQAGSDEVGTGDFFGPVVVCATCISSTHLDLMKALKIQDSKQLNDSQITQIAQTLIKEIPYVLLILDNQKYNEVHPTNNMNAIKAKLHNSALRQLLVKLPFKPEQIIIDQFTPEKTYYRYLSEEENVIKGITFQTKAENAYYAVACASIIARYAFVESMNRLSKAYKCEFPKGAGVNVDTFGKNFIARYGVETLNQVSKTHFSNYQRIIKK